MKSAGFHGLPLNAKYAAYYFMKYTGYLAFSGRGVLGEIWQISWQWNLAHFMKSSGFHGLPLNAKYAVYYFIKYRNTLDI